MGKLIITPEILALKAEREALEKQEEQEEQDRVPPRVAAFWFAEEADVPPWRMESSEERERRDKARKKK
jgi:hypothetical protein